MVAHEKRNPAQLFCAVPTQNDLALSSLLFSDHPTQKLEYPAGEYSRDATGLPTGWSKGGGSGKQSRGYATGLPYFSPKVRSGHRKQCYLNNTAHHF